MAARRRDRMPEFRRGEGIAGAGAHLRHQRPGHVRRGLSAARLGIGRERPARLQRRSAGAARRHSQRFDTAALAGGAAERSAVIGRQLATTAAAASGRAAIVSVAALPAAAAAISAAAVSATSTPIGNAGRPTVVAQSARRGAARRRRGFGRPRRPAASLLRRPRSALHTGAAEHRATHAAGAAARTAARAADHRLGRTGRSETRGDARLPDRLGARSMDHDRGAAGGAEMVPSAGGGDQANLRLFVSRHERQSERAYFRARLRQRARHRRVHAGRRPQNLGAIWLAGRAGGAGFSARRAGRGVRGFHHRAGARRQRLSLQSHPRRSDAAL